MNRRSDHQLRQAIRALEELLLSDTDTDQVLMSCLEQLIELLSVDFGYVFRCRNSDLSDVQFGGWELTGYLERVDQQLVALANTCTSYQIPSDLFEQFLLGKAAYGEVSELGAHPLPSRHPKLENFYCLPLADSDSLHCVFYLWNGAESVFQNLEFRLRPFVAAAGSLLRSIRSKPVSVGMSSNAAAARNDETREALEKAKVEGLSDEELQRWMDAMLNGLVVLDSESRIEFCNRSASALFGQSREQLIGQAVGQFFAPSGGRQNTYLDLDYRSGNFLAGNIAWRSVLLELGQGEQRLVDLSTFEFTLAGRHIAGLVMVDVSERFHFAAESLNNLQRFRILGDLAPVGILQLDDCNRCIYANHCWADYTGQSLDELYGEEWMTGICPEDRGAFLNSLEYEIRLKGSYQGQIRLAHQSGHLLWAKVSASSLYSESGVYAGQLLTFSDITDHLDQERRLRDVSEKDSLTGLVNRRFFNDRLQVALQGCGRFGSVALITLNLDGFKLINDSLGVVTGDAVLKGVAERLEDVLRKADTISRVGGDEFTLILTNVTHTGSLTAIANKLMESFARPFIVNSRPVYVSCSLGIAVAHSPSVSLVQLIKESSIALSRAKEAGKNHFRFYTAELDRDAGIQLHLSQSLKEPGRTDFRLVYQPQLDTRTGAVVGMEALARWQHPDTGVIGPGVFIKMIEESGLIDEFSNWLFDSVFEDAAQWSDWLATGKKISINLSAKQFRNQDLALIILRACQAHELKPAFFTLEVTETAFVVDSELAVSTLQQLNQMGFEIALDDFGTGYSSLLYLRKMPLGTIKIDRSFVKGVVDENEDAKIVTAILALAETMNLRVIAEGVESPLVSHWLSERGCYLQQGNYFYPALEHCETETLLDRLAPVFNSETSSSPETSADVMASSGASSDGPAKRSALSDDKSKT